MYINFVNFVKHLNKDKYIIYSKKIKHIVFFTAKF